MAHGRCIQHTETRCNSGFCYPPAEQVQEPIQHDWGGDYKESNYDVNILSVNEENCVITKENKVLFDFLEKNKINPIVSKFRDKQFWDNGIHCVTQDLYREGEMEDYFHD